MSNNSRF